MTRYWDSGPGKFRSSGSVRQVYNVDPEWYGAH
jgi:hypothetical protein